MKGIILVSIAICVGAGLLTGCGGGNDLLLDYWQEMGMLDYDNHQGDAQEVFEDGPRHRWGIELADLDPERYPVNRAMYEAYRRGWIEACESDPQREVSCTETTTPNPG